MFSDKIDVIFERAFTYLGGMYDEIADGISVLSAPQRVESKVSWGKWAGILKAVQMTIF